MADPPEADIPLRPDYGNGIYRRRIRVMAAGDRVDAELADDFHHFAVELQHDGGRVREIAGRAIRIPWTTCADSTGPLERLRGASLTPSLFAVARHTDPRLQCTHLFDLAALAIAHAARRVDGGAPQRQYDVELPDRGRAATETRLLRNGRELLAWRVKGLRIVDAQPPIFAGHKLSGAGFGRLVEHGLDPELGEAALVLRRGIFIGIGRRYDFDRIRHAETFAPVVGAACHTFSPAHVGTADRVLGSVRDFTDAPERIFEGGDGDEP